MGLLDVAFFMIKQTPLPNGNYPILSPVCPMGVADTLEQWWINGKHGQGNHSTKMGAAISAENKPGASKIFGSICLLKSKSLGFSKKKLCVSVVLGYHRILVIHLYGP